MAILEPGTRILETVTDPEVQRQLGFPLGEANEVFQGNFFGEGDAYDTAVLLDEDLDTKSPTMDIEIRPILTLSQERYEEAIASEPAIRASEARWIDAYTSSKERPSSIFEIIQTETPKVFFSELLDALDLPIKDRVEIAHLAAIMNHPGAGWTGEPTSNKLFTAALEYLEKQREATSISIADYEKDFDVQNSFTRFVTGRVSRELASGAINDLIDLASPDKQGELTDRQNFLKEAFQLNLEKYLDSIKLDWEILPDSMGEDELLGALGREAAEHDWTFDKERFLFLKAIKDAGGGDLYRSSRLAREDGCYIGAVLPSPDGYVVVADNPYNVEQRNHAAYIAIETDIATNPRTQKAYEWEQVLSEDKPTARDLGAFPRRHSTNHKQNVIDSLPRSIRSKFQHLA